MNTLSSATASAPPSIDQLRELQLPETIGFWPPAPGWWFLGLLLLGLIIGAGIYARRHWQRNGYRRAALSLLAQHHQQLQRDGDQQHYLSQLSSLLRRTALTAYPQHPIAGLTNKGWQDFLCRSSGLEEFQRSLGELLSQGPYQRQCSFDADAVQRLVARWIRDHKRRLTC